jgi:NAD(P)-dependent dehydrogenase (short-subunit alcohol dehydrogenase family)
MFPASSTSLEGQTILILGGTSGIGYGVAVASLHAGAAKVIIGSPSAEKVEKAIERCRQSAAKASLRVHGIVRGVIVDAKDPTTIENVVGELGTINHLVFTCGDDVGQARGVNIREVDIEEMKGEHSSFSEV